MANVSVQDLLEKAANLGDADSARSLMNLVMQFRKVCNHPELFERADVVAPFSFSEFGRPGPLNREGDFVQLPYSTRNPIEYKIPTLFLQDGGLLDVPQEDSLMRTGNGPLARMMNIWSTDSIYRSLGADCECRSFYSHLAILITCISASTFSFLKFVDAAPSEISVFHSLPTMARELRAMQLAKRDSEIRPYDE